MVTSRQMGTSQELTGIKCEGYGFVAIPSEPGSHFLSVETWKLKPRTVCDQMKYVFLNNAPFLEDIHAAHIPPRNINVRLIQRELASLFMLSFY